MVKSHLCLGGAEVEEVTFDYIQFLYGPTWWRILISFSDKFDDASETVHYIVKYIQALYPI